MTTLKELEKNPTKVNRKEKHRLPSEFFLNSVMLICLGRVFIFNKSLYFLCNTRKDLAKESENYYMLLFPTRTSVEVCQNNNSLLFRIVHYVSW